MKKDVYIMITQTGTKFSRVLQLFTHAPYNHASIALDENLELLYSFARQNLHIPIFAGFVKEDINKGVYKLHDNTLCEIYRISISDKQYIRLQKLIEEFEKNEDKYGYNFVGLITMLFNIPYHREHHYVCSQFVAYFLHDSNSINFEKHYSLIRPQDFTSLSELDLIYSGKLSNYTA